MFSHDVQQKQLIGFIFHVLSSFVCCVISYYEQLFLFISCFAKCYIVIKLILIQLYFVYKSRYQ